MKRRFAVIIKQTESSKYKVIVPLLPECTGEGDTREEALAGAEEAIKHHIEELRAEGENIPMGGEISRLSGHDDFPEDIEETVIEVAA